jgi:hypothetical protein
MMDSPLLGIMESYEEEGAFEGALLVVDRRGIPIEARWSKSTTVTQALRMLYGKKLIEYVSIDCISLPLFQATANKPAMILIRRNYLLGLRTHVDVPVFLVTKKEVCSETGERTAALNITLSPHKGFPSDSDYMPELTNILSSVDPIEVFDRIPQYLRAVKK